MTPHNLALITGASSGIGAALARLLASKKIALILHGRNEQKLDELASSLSSQVDVSILATDLTKREALISLIREKVPDLVINNAGFSLYGDALESSVQEQMKIHDVNGAASLEITLEAAHALLRAKKPGVILNVSSVLGDIPSPGTAIYGASKGFVTLFSQSLDYEFAPHHIRVLVSCPGQVVTPFAARAAKKATITRKGP
ncbi:MAG: 3-oxoacyl-[acyl-carrier-protein] reductase FabG, partial [Chlamydiae bacterium]|nr:3-oxoacyl-[acyl-carrier-protein] reductase FabG [Chlamydiota bacterium]